MTTIVVLNVNGTMIRVECDGIARDGVLPKNIVLTGCKELDTEARDGSALDTKLWSVPETAVLSYAVGKGAVKEAPPAAEPIPVEAPPERVWTEEEKAARRARYAARDAAVRERRAARAAPKPPEAEPVAEPSKPAKQARRRKKPADTSA